jgi:hypothetical protein
LDDLNTATSEKTPAENQSNRISKLSTIFVAENISARLQYNRSERIGKLGKTVQTAE